VAEREIIDVKVGILSNPQYPKTGELASRIHRALDKRKVETFCSTAEHEEQEALFPPDLDVLITLGGDGTMLRAAHLQAANATPILGIHMGRLGFLAEVRLGDWEASLDRVCAGEYWLEERAMLCCHLARGDETMGPWEALNEVVISRCGMGHMIQLATYVDNGYFTTYVADGLIVATATGSTAYALSAGGPILPPELHNMVLVPICPHLSLDRTIVLAEGATVQAHVELVSEGALIVDGVTETQLRPDDRVVLSKSPHVTRFVRLYDRRQVYETLIERLTPRKVNKPHDTG
jgi:NAD+ kinase